MKVSAGQAARIAAKPDPAIRAILFYGPNQGLVAELAETATRAVAEDPADPFRVALLTPQILREDPARLTDEAATMALTGGRRVVRLRGAADAQSAALSAFLDAPAGDALVVVEAGTLGPRSSLRTLFEQAGNAAAAPCYEDDGDALEALAERVLRDGGVAIEPDALAFLASRLSGDRRLIRAELDKLVLYAGRGTTLNLDDVAAAVGDAADLSLDDLVMAVADGDLPAIGRAHDRAVAEGASSVAIVRAALRHFRRLHEAAGHVADGKSPDQALRQLKPRPLPRAMSRLQAQLARWPSSWLAAAIDRLLQAEIDCKSTGMPDAAITGRTLLEMGQAAARRRR